jgi:multifunctional methyltransferase subunit TRM112
MLICNVKKCAMQGYPLQIVPVTVNTEESDFNPEFIVHILPRLDWRGVLAAAANVRHSIVDGVFCCVFFGG